MMVSGDTPVIVGPDGPSLGGFVVPAAIIRADLWKLGQLRPGDRVRLEPVTPQAAAHALAERRAELADVRQAMALREAGARTPLPCPPETDTVFAPSPCPPETDSVFASSLCPPQTDSVFASSPSPCPPETDT